MHSRKQKKLAKIFYYLSDFLRTELNELIIGSVDSRGLEIERESLRRGVDAEAALTL